MTLYHFALTLGGVTADTAGLEDALYAAGCDDALICFYGKAVYLEFDRESDNFAHAICSAISDIESATISAKVISVDSSLVGLSDIAELTELSRQAIAMLKDGTRGPGGFPSPIQRLGGASPLWRWADVAAWPDFLQKLSDQSRYASKPPEMLLTHPLPDSRLSDARNRANQMPKHIVQSSQDYLMAKVRALGMYSSEGYGLNEELLGSLSKGNVREQAAAKYGRAIQFYEAKKYDDARNIIQPMLAQDAKNVWLIDLMTDIDLGQKRAPQAIARLQAANAAQSNNPVLQLNLANAYVEGNQPAQASKILNRYTFAHPDDPNGWDLLAQASAAQGLRDEELSARAESLALNGRLDQAIGLLSNASSLQKLGSLKQARYDARIDQLRQLQQRFRQYQRS